MTDSLFSSSDLHEEVKPTKVIKSKAHSLKSKKSV